MGRKRYTPEQIILVRELPCHRLPTRSPHPRTNDLYIAIVEIVGSIVGRGRGLGSHEDRRSGIRRDLAPASYAETQPRHTLVS